VFRWYVSIRLGLLLLVLGSLRRNPNPGNPRFPQSGILLFGLLALLLFWPAVQRRLGRAFLPVALTVASAAPIIESAATIKGRLDAGLGVNAAFVDYWQPFFLLFVPLLLIAWQYRYRAVLFFAIVTTFLDLALIVPLVEGRNAALDLLGGLVLARGLLYAFVGLFIVKLVGAQKQARRTVAIHGATLERLATSRERNRLARELHDTLAHSLSGLAVQLEAVRTLLDDDPDEARAMLDRSLQSARDGLGEARRAIQALRAVPLEELGLAGALEQLGSAAAVRSAMKVTVSVGPGIDDLNPELEQAIYRIADEALTNAARHSGGSQATVEVTRTGNLVRLLVGDDGVGLDSTTAVVDGHIGMQSMRERAEMVGGALTVFGDRGTTVRFEVSPWK